MYLETIRFDRVYEVRKFDGKSGPQMSFKFDAEGVTNQKAYSNVHVDISAGDTFTVALAKRNDWQSILGFWNAENKKLFVRPTTLGDIIGMSVLWAAGSAMPIFIVFSGMGFVASV